MEAPYYPPHVDQALRHIDGGMYLLWNPTGVLVSWQHWKPNGDYAAPEFEGRYEVRCRDAWGEDYFVLLLELDGEYVQPGDWMLAKIWKHHLEKYDGDLLKYHEETVVKPNEEYDRKLEAAQLEVEEYAGRELASALTAKQYGGGDFIKTKSPSRGNWF